METLDEARIARSSVAASVTPVPSLLEMGMLRSSESSLSWWPTPCTSTILIRGS